MRSWMGRAVVLGVGVVGTGCFSSKMAQTAEPLGEGMSELAISFNASQVANLAEGGDWAVWPNLLPNIHYGIGLSDSMDFFGNFNFGSSYLESGVKLALAQTDSGTLSILPSAGWAPLGFYSGARFSLPVMYTQRMSPTFALSLMGTASYQMNNAGSSGVFAEIGVASEGDELGLGGGLGVEFRGRALYVRPSVTYTYYRTAFSNSGDSTDWSLGQLTFTVGRTGGKTEAQLDRIEQKLDDLSQ